MIWGQADIAKLRELAALGLTNRQMAERLGISRNAIAGAVFRFKLKRAAKPAKPAKPRHAPPVAVPLPGYMPNGFECHWISDNGPWHPGLPQWCGQPAAPGSPYCPEHHNRCYTTRLPHALSLAVAPPRS